MTADPWASSTFGTGALDWSPGLEWHDQAACASVGIELFFADKPGETEPAKLAKRICNGSEKHGIPVCPVLDTCLEWALETNEAWGIFGGQSPRSRAKMRNQRRRDQGLTIRCRTCRMAFIPVAHQVDCSDACRLVSRRRREARRRAS